MVIAKQMQNTVDGEQQHFLHGAMTGCGGCWAATHGR